MTRTGPAGRVNGWDAPVGVPEDLDALRGPTTGVVRLPRRVHSSGAGPAETFDLDDERQRIALYQIVLTEAGAEDIAAYVDRDELRRLWPRLYLSPHVRRAWQPKLTELLGD